MSNDNVVAVRNAYALRRALRYPCEQVHPTLWSRIAGTHSTGNLPTRGTRRGPAKCPQNLRAMQLHRRRSAGLGGANTRAPSLSRM